MRYKGIEWTLKHPGLTDEEFRRLIDLDEKEVAGTLTWCERLENNRLLAKMRRARDQKQSQDQ